jgi:hypothetical protein
MSTTETPAAPVEEAKAVETPTAPEVAAEAAVAVSIFVPYSRHFLILVQEAPKEEVKAEVSRAIFLLACRVTR